MSLPEKTKNNFALTVSIGDAEKAVIALRSYGLSVKEAEETIHNESIIAIYEHSIIPQKALAPELIEYFGIQHIEDALRYTYLYLDELDINWETYKMILLTLLKVYRPEELIVNPECIRFFINGVDNLVFEKIVENTPDAKPLTTSLVYADILDNLSCDDIKNLASDPFDYSEDCDEDD